MNWRRLFLMVSLVAVTVATSYGLSVVADDSENEEREEAVALKKVPAAVQATMLVEILREVDGLKLEEIEREDEDGRIVYEAEFEYGDKDIELEISADGKLLSKEVELEEDEEEEDDK